MFPYPISFLNNADEAFSSTKSLNFDGVDDYVETPAVFSLLDGLTNFAFSFWFKTSSFSYKQLFWIDGSSATANYAQTQLVVRPNYLIWYFNNNSYYVYSNNNLVANTWYHCLCTRDASRATGDKARIYINGVNESASDSSVGLTTLETSTSGLKLGDGDFRSPFSGFIDEFAVYNQDMAAYIDEIYNSGTPDDLNNLATAPAPNIWYRMGENSTFSSQILMPENTNKDTVSNYSFDFDGVDDYVSCGTITALNGLSQASWSCWIKVAAGETSFYPFGQDEVGGNNGIKPFFLDTGRCDIYLSALRFRVLTDATVIGLFDQNWHNITITFNKDNSPSTTICALYIDGVAITNTWSASNAVLPTLTEPFEIGRWQNNLTNFGGNIDELGIWNTELTQLEVTELYNSGTPNDLSTHSKSADLVKWYRMGEDATFNTNWTIPDQIGSNNGRGANMTIEDRVGDASNSSNNSLSYNMVEADIEEEAP